MPIGPTGRMEQPVNPLYTTEDQRWAAVGRRDAGADGAFVYAVRTTGFYCRPSCGSRLPRRENVAFHFDSAAAEAAGFRACKRCCPNADSVAAREAVGGGAERPKPYTAEKGPHT